MRFTFLSPRISGAKGRLSTLKRNLRNSVPFKEFYVNDRGNGYTRFKTKNGYTVSVELGEGLNPLPKMIEVSSNRGYFYSNEYQQVFKSKGTEVVVFPNDELRITKPWGDVYYTDDNKYYVYSKKQNRDIHLKPETFYDRTEKDLVLFDQAKELAKREIKNSKLSDGIEGIDGDSDLIDLFAETLKRGGKLNYLNYIK